MHKKKSWFKINELNMLRKHPKSNKMDNEEFTKYIFNTDWYNSFYEVEIVDDQLAL